MRRFCIFHHINAYSVYYAYSAMNLHILIEFFISFVDASQTESQSTFVYKRRESAQVFYVVPASSILGRLPLVHVGNTGTIVVTLPFEMQGESADFPGAPETKTFFILNMQNMQNMF
jgi:hypothetical protein